MLLAASRARNKRIFDLWLACCTQDEIAAAVGVTQDAVSRVLREIETFRFCVNLGESSDIADEQKRFDEIEKQNRELATHARDFTPPLYNVWKQQTKTNGSAHFGNSEIRWVTDNA